MNRFEDIEALWNTAIPRPVPDASEIIRKAGKERRQVARSLLFQGSCLGLSIVALVFVLFKVKFNYLSSYAGIALMFIAVIGFMYVRLKQSLFLHRLNFNDPPNTLLLQLEKFHRQQQWVNTRGVLIYTILLNLAFALYFYETLFLAPLSTAWKIGIIVVYIAWMLVATLILGRRSARKETQRTQAIIGKIKQLQSMLDQPA